MGQPATALTVAERVESSPAIVALEARTAALMDLLPGEEAVARFKRGVVVAITKNPDLLKCTPDSIVLACFEAASQGLEPTGAAGGAHLVPYGDKAQMIPDYRGVIRMVTKPGSAVGAMEAGVVKEGDEFSYQRGSEGWVHHVPSLDPDRSTRATTHVYSIAHLRAGGRPLVDVMDRAAVERIRQRSRAKAQGPWATDWDEMGCKTVIKHHSKVLPVPSDVRAILQREDELAGELDADPTLDDQPTGPTKVSRLAGRIRNVTPADAGAAEASPGPAAPAADQPPDWATAGATAGATADPEKVAAVAEALLVDRLQQLVDASAMQGPMAEPQKARLGQLIGQGSQLDWAGEVIPVLRLAFGDDFAPGDMTGAQAQAVINLADSLEAATPPIDFADAWRAAAPKEA